MKKLMFVALSMVVSSMVFAHGGDFQNRQNPDNTGFWDEMNDTHNVMHNTSISEKRSENGITFEVTSKSDATIESIKKRFVDDQTQMESYFKEVDVTVNTLDRGFEITLESNNKKTVAKLQSNGKNMIYRYLHSRNGRFGSHMGNHHGGHGSGMMHGWGNQNEMGPGMMFWDRDGSQNDSESYNRRYDHMRYNYDMM